MTIPSNKIIEGMIHTGYDYDMFTMHANNRALTPRKDLERSMKEFGFMPSSAIQCVYDPELDKLVVIRGNHRFSIAKKLKIPVKYIVDPSLTDFTKLEPATQNWRLTDWVFSYANAGNSDYMFLLAYAKEHKLPITVASSLLATNSASGLKGTLIKFGKFKKSEDISHATRVLAFADKCNQLESFTKGKTVYFLRAVSSLDIGGVSLTKLIEKILKYPRKLVACTQTAEYLRLFEEIYNFNVPEKSKVPLVYLAQKAMRERNPIKLAE